MTTQTMKVKFFSSALFVTLSWPCLATSGTIAIINGATNTSESGTTSSITSNLDALLQAAGNTTSIYDMLPSDLSSYDQVWDIRFSNASALTASDTTAYQNYLFAGGGVFLMGENASFMARNNSIFALVGNLGGGVLQYANGGSTQTVQSPFTGPNIIGDGDVTFAAPGGVSTAGTGDFMTVDSNGIGSAIAFSVGDLTNAPLGALAIIFDVNFMQAYYDQPDSQLFLKNLISYVEEQVDPPTPNAVPEPTTALLLGTGLAGLAAAGRKKMR